MPGVYIYIHRERERDRPTFIYIYIDIYIHTHHNNNNNNNDDNNNNDNAIDNNDNNSNTNNSSNTNNTNNMCVIFCPDGYSGPRLGSGGIRRKGVIRLETLIELEYLNSGFSNSNLTIRVVRAYPRITETRL